MTQENRLSFYSILLLIFLLPLFFIPSPLLPIGISKTLLIAIILLVSCVGLLLSIYKEKKLSLPKSKLVWGALALPGAYLISALASTTPSLSLFGYDFEIGTAASIALLAALFFVALVSFQDKSRLLRAYSALFLSGAVMLVFSAVKILSGGKWLTLGTFAGNMANPVGSWTDLSTLFGVIVVISIFALEMLPLGGMMGLFLWVAYALSLVLLALIGFSTMWAMLLGSGLVLLVYFITVEGTNEETKGKWRKGVWAAGILTFVSLIFVWNPTFSERSLSAIVSQVANVNNTEVRPSLSTTLSVGHSALAKDPILGSGPLTFDKDWLQFKSPSINNTIFWNTAFPFGFGFLPTAIATTGLLGTLVWGLFLAFFISLGMKILSKSPQGRADRFIVISAFLVSLFLWVASFLYVPSLVILALAFVFTGLTVSAAAATGVIGSMDLSTNASRLTRFASTIVILIIIFVIAALGFVFGKKTLSVVQFEKALSYVNGGGQSPDVVEGYISKALSLSSADEYWSAVSQVELSRANAALQSTASTTEERQAVFGSALGKAISALQSAVSANPTYSNWIAVGNLYDSLVPAPFSLTGAYDNASVAYANAKKLNPQSPEVALLLARLELDNKNADGARAHVNEALALKQDYADAYFLLSQLEVSQNNLTEAIKSAETGVLLTPNNAGVVFELGLLKYSNKDYAGAVDALEKALAITPDYANAKYYLGLSLDKLGKHTDAIAQFEDLAKSNPDNAAVTQALANLKAGRDALYAPASATKPKTAPISGQ